ncbi:MAG: tyrosine-type recombinase/integrase [Faecalibacterium sp.]
MDIQKALKEYLIEIEVQKYTPRTIRSYRNNLNLFLRFCEEKADVHDTEELTLGTVRKFTMYMNQRGKKGTYINGVLKCVKVFIQYCYQEEYGGFNTRRSFKWCKEEKPIITTFSGSDVKKLLESCRGNDYLSVRNRTILTMLFETGIRCLELCSITDEDIHEDYIIIKGKNHKQRVVPITPILRKTMAKYQVARDANFELRMTDKTYFLSCHGKRLTNSAVERILKQCGEGICGVRVSPHTCRHFFAQQHVKMGTDLYTISRLLGHENIGITQTYLNSLQDKDVVQMTKNRSVIQSI